jgi:hypothetical protein
MCKIADGREIERHKVSFKFRLDKNHDNILHGVNAVYEKLPNGQLINLSKQGRLTKKERSKLKKQDAK